MPALPLVCWWDVSTDAADAKADAPTVLTTEGPPTEDDSDESADSPSPLRAVTRGASDDKPAPEAEDELLLAATLAARAARGVANGEAAETEEVPADDAVADALAPRLAAPAARALAKPGRVAVALVAAGDGRGDIDDIPARRTGEAAVAMAAASLGAAAMAAAATRAAAGFASSRVRSSCALDGSERVPPADATERADVAKDACDLLRYFDDSAANTEATRSDREGGSSDCTAAPAVAAAALTPPDAALDEATARATDAAVGARLRDDACALLAAEAAASLLAIPMPPPTPGTGAAAAASELEEGAPADVTPGEGAALELRAPPATREAAPAEASADGSTSAALVPTFCLALEATLALCNAAAIDADEAVADFEVATGAGDGAPAGSVLLRVDEFTDVTAGAGFVFCAASTRATARATAAAVASSSAAGPPFLRRASSSRGCASCCCCSSGLAMLVAIGVLSGGCCGGCTAGFGTMESVTKSSLPAAAIALGAADFSAGLTKRRTCGRREARSLATRAIRRRRLSMRQKAAAQQQPQSSRPSATAIADAMAACSRTDEAPSVVTDAL